MVGAMIPRNMPVLPVVGRGVDTSWLATLLVVPCSGGPVPGGREPTPRWGLARVVNRSMLPTLRPGDRLLLSYRQAPRPGALVVARLPGGVLATKRAVERRPTELGEP